MPRPRDRPPPAVKCAQIKKPTPRNENMIKSGRIPNKVAIEIWSRATSLPKPPKPPKPPKRPNRACVELFTCLAHFWRLIHALWGAGGWGVAAGGANKQPKGRPNKMKLLARTGTRQDRPALRSEVQSSNLAVCCLSICLLGTAKLQHTSGRRRIAAYT